MHPADTAVLSPAGFDGVCLANNHVMDWGRARLQETTRRSMRWVSAAPAPARTALRPGRR